MSTEEIIKELEKKGNITRFEILQKIDQKISNLFGLVTQEVAAYLVAKDLGVELLQSERKQLQIKNIVSGIKNVSFVGRVFKISGITEFKKSNGKGRVANLFIADNTGFVRVPLWNDQVRLVENEEVKVGDILQINGGFSRENVYGDLEISIGKFGTLRPAEEYYDLLTSDELAKKYFSNIPQLIKISESAPGKFELHGTIVQLFKSKFLFESDGENAMIISCAFDDGTGDMRMVFFRNLAEKLSGISIEEFLQIPEENRYEFLERKILGRQIEVVGRIKKSQQQSDTLEMIADELEDLNPLDESKKLVEEIDLMLGG